MTLFCLTALSGAYAAEEDPFHFDPESWKTSSHYIQDAAHPSPAAPAQNAASDNDENASAVPAVPIAAVPAPIPTVNAPVMPGVNQGYAVSIDSTEKDNASSAPVQDASADPRLSDANWLSPSLAASDAVQDNNGENGETMLKVRMTFLPSKLAEPKVAEHKSGLEMGRAQARQNALLEEAKKNASKDKTPAEAQACAAIDNYKKQQIDAIQSDRRTLKALQDAIHSLGLNKQLDFSSGTFSAAASAGSSTAGAPKTSVR